MSQFGAGRFAGISQTVSLVYGEVDIRNALEKQAGGGLVVL